jgi:hypothetical protein
MPRNTCPTCRAENLGNAIICVACETIFDDRRAAAASSTVETGDPWTPPIPVRPVGARGNAPALSIVREAPKERIPPRPD